VALVVRQAGAENLDDRAHQGKVLGRPLEEPVAAYFTAP
jgi:hypothetical protein